MSSPNEPGLPGAGERPASGEGTTEIPPWQAGGARRAANPRASRYVTGLAAPDLSAMGAVPQRPDPDPAPVQGRTGRCV